MVAKYCIITIAKIKNENSMTLAKHHKFLGESYLQFGKYKEAVEDGSFIAIIMHFRSHFALVLWFLRECLANPAVSKIRLLVDLVSKGIDEHIRSGALRAGLPARDAKFY